MMHRTLVLCAASILAALFFSTIASAQVGDNEAITNWDRVTQIPKAQQVEVSLWNRTTLQGSIQEVESDGLTFVQGKQVTKVRREDIARVTTWSRKKGAEYGLMIGGAVGALFGAGTGRLQGVKAGLGAAAIWTLLGTAIGAGRGATQTLYRGEQPEHPVSSEPRPAHAR